MDSYQLFSKRNKAPEHDIFEYDYIPEKLRNQIYYIWKDALDIDHALRYMDGYPARTFEKIHDTVCREHGFEQLVNLRGGNRFVPHAKMCEYFLKNSDIHDNEVLLDLIEVSMRHIDFLNSIYAGAKMPKSQAVKELNVRFRENGIGYEFSEDILIRKDSEILHEEVTKPALQLLHEQEFKGALDEYLKAHDHYRKGNYGDSILNAGKAFESTMKTIGSKESWGLTGKESAAELIGLLVTYQVVPSYLQTTLQGLATLRNKVAGHGQGQVAVQVPEHFVNYALHLCGTNIVMLIEAYKDYSK